MYVKNIIAMMNNRMDFHKRDLENYYKMDQDRIHKKHPYDKDVLGRKIISVESRIDELNQIFMALKHVVEKENKEREEE